MTSTPDAADASQPPVAALFGASSAPGSGLGDGLGQPAGDVSVFFEAEGSLILLSGEIDLALADDLEHAGRDVIDARRPIVADVRRVSFVDSVGGSFLVRLAAAAMEQDTTLRLLGPSPAVRELLALLGASELVQWQEAAG